MVWLEACLFFAISVFFSFAGDYFTTRDARRLYGYITGGLSLGILVSGYAVDPVVHWIGTDNLLLVCAALLVLGAVVAFLIHRSARPVGHGESEEEEESEAPLKSVLRSPYLLLTFVIVLAFSAVMVLVNYNMMVVASRQMQEEEMAAFFGKFYGYTGAASLLVQFLLVGWVLSRLGAIKSLLILPALMVPSNLGSFLHPTLLMAAAANFVFIALGETLDLPATELLFLPLPTRIRLRVQTLVDGALAPIGHGLGGVFLILFSGWVADVPQVALMVVLLALLWITLIILLLPHYRHTLATSLKERRFDPSDLDALLSRQDSSSVLADLLKSQDPDLALSALELLRNQPLDKVANQVGELVFSKHEPVAISALQLLGSDRKFSHMPRIRHALGDPRPDVRSAAVLALCQAAGLDAVSEAAPYLEAAEPSVRRAALLGLARYGGFDGALLGYPKLDSLLKSPSPEDRIEAARVMAQIGDHGATRVMERLFSDPEKAVRQEALLAARQLRDPGLVPSLLLQMDDLQMRPLAIQALDAMPQEAVPEMALAALDTEAGISKRTVLARILGNVGGEQAPQILWRLLAPDEDLVLRVTAGHALRRLKAREGLHGMELVGMDERWEQLCGALSLLHRARQECEKEDPMAGSLFADHARLHIELLMTLLSLQHDSHQIQQIESRLFGDNQALKANALELLEVILLRPVAERLIPLLSEAEASTNGGGEELSAEMARRLMRADPWMRAIALYRLAKGDQLPGSLGGETMTEQDKDLYKVITTISFLKQVDLFRNVPANYLAGLAEIARGMPAHGVFDIGVQRPVSGQGPPGRSRRLVITLQIGLQLPEEHRLFRQAALVARGEPARGPAARAGARVTTREAAASVATLNQPDMRGSDPQSSDASGATSHY